MRNTVIFIALGFTSGILGGYSYHWLGAENTPLKATQIIDTFPSEAAEEARLATYDRVDTQPAFLADDFITASSMSTPSVVYIKTFSEQAVGRRSWLDLFFDLEGRQEQRVSSGSGVIYTSDGYIISNNHVIEEADRIEVIVGKQTYEAMVIGADPSTDIAVMRIDEDDLPSIGLGKSKDLKVGEWVIAVGNPFNLTSTVTAGIVSAKGREINILKGKFPIESFIQTDAAINPGNSGGALVNRQGELVGINTAILSRTGSYAGYGFAVPIDIARKVVDDLIEYGEVQKPFWGGSVADIDREIGERLELDNLYGVVIWDIQKEGAAEAAGLERGDVIISLDDNPINSRSEFEELLSYHYPGDKVTIEYKRKNQSHRVSISLTNREGTTKLLKREVYNSSTLGAEFEVVSKVERDILDIDHGVRVIKVKDGFFSNLDIEEGFIVTSVNNQPIKDPETLVKMIERIRGRVIIEGINKRGVRGYYSYYF